jgi:transglycosylase-like protein
MDYPPDHLERILMTDCVSEFRERTGACSNLRDLPVRLPRGLVQNAYAFIAGVGERRSVHNVANAFVARELRMPEHLVRLLIAIEDKRFWFHPGVDPIGAIRAMWMNSRRVAGRQGASTLREQVAKFGRSTKPRHPLIDRCYRGGLSVVSQLTFGMSRRQVLATYLETVYIGRSCYGFREAAKEYFGVDVATVSAGQAIFLVDRVALPNRWRPGRLRNLLKRRIVFDLVKHDLAAIPIAYERAFGARAGAEVNRVVDEIRYAEAFR